MPLSVRPRHSPLSSFISSTLLLIHACGKVHQHGRVVMIKEAVCLLNYVYAIESEIAELTVNDSYEYLGRGQRPSDIHILYSYSLFPPSHLSLFPSLLPLFLTIVSVLQRVAVYVCSKTIGFQQFYSCFHVILMVFTDRQSFPLQRLTPIYPDILHTMYVNSRVRKKIKKLS